MLAMLEAQNVLLFAVVLTQSCCLSVLAIGWSGSKSPEADLIDNLFAEYNKDARPVLRYEDSVNVSMGIALANIYDIDEKHKLLKMKGWMHHEWKDHHLKWDPSSYDGIQQIVVSESRIWRPDVLLYNYAEGMYFADEVEGRVKITCNGTVSWVPIATLFKTSCKFNMRHFPYDSQTCRLMFGSWVYSTREVNLTILKKHKNKVHYAGDEWKIHEVDLSTHVLGNYEAENEEDTFTVAVLTIRMSRHGAYYTHVFLIPSVLLAIVTLVMFLVPPESGERLTLGIGVIIAATLLMLMLENHLPEEVAEVPVIASYLVFVYIMVVLALIMTVLVLNFHHRDVRRGKVPDWMRKYILGKLSSFVCMSADTYRSIPTNDPGALDSESAPVNLDQATPNDLRLDKELSEESPLPKSPTMALEKTLDEIRRYLRICAAKATLPEPLYSHRQIVVNEWHQVALVIDRLLFIVFLFITLITTFAMYH